MIYDHLLFNVFVIFLMFFCELLSNVFVFGEGYFFKTLPTPQQGWSLNRSNIVINPVFEPKIHNQEIKKCYKSDDQEIQKCLKHLQSQVLVPFPPSGRWHLSLLSHCHMAGQGRRCDVDDDGDDGDGDDDDDDGDDDIYYDEVSVCHEK